MSVSVRFCLWMNEECFFFSSSLSATAIPEGSLMPAASRAPLSSHSGSSPNNWSMPKQPLKRSWLSLTGLLCKFCQHAAGLKRAVTCKGRLWSKCQSVDLPAHHLQVVKHKIKNCQIMKRQAMFVHGFERNKKL